MRIFVSRIFETPESKDFWLKKLSGDSSMGNIQEAPIKVGDNEYYKVTVESFHSWVNTKLLYPDAFAVDKVPETKPAARKANGVSKKKVLEKK